MTRCSAYTKDKRARCLLDAGHEGQHFNGTAYRHPEKGLVIKRSEGLSW